MPIPVWQSIIAVVIVLLGAFMAIFHKKPLKVKWRVFYTVSFLVLGGSSVALTWIQERITHGREEKNRRESREQIESLATNVNAKVSALSAQLDSFKKQQQSLVDVLATNSSVSLETRQRIIESDKEFQVFDSQISDLNDFVAKLRNKAKERRALQQMQREKELAEYQTLYEQNLPYFADAITTFTEMIGKVGTQMGDKVVKKDLGLPAAIGIDVGETNVAEIKLQRNPDWDFHIYIGGIHAYPTRRPLQIKCKGGDLKFWVERNSVETDLSLLGEKTEVIVKPLADYKKVIGDALGYLIAKEYDLSAGTNK